MNYQIREMTVKDYKEVIDLWSDCEGITLDDTDSYESIRKYLDRNPKLCHVAFHEGLIIGAVKCGQDGRRGYLHHLGVKKQFRNRGIGRTLVKSCLLNLAKQGIEKCNTFALKSNELGQTFWKNNGWNKFEEYYYTFQKNIEND